MADAYLNYTTRRGFIDNWIVAGPQATPVEGLERFSGADTKLQIARHSYTADPGVAERPAEQAQLALGDEKLPWRYVSCRDDHYVDLSAFYHTYHYLRAWAYAELELPEGGPATWTLTTNGPADVWVNGRHAHRQEHFHHQLPHSVSFEVELEAGWNTVLVRMEEVAARECPYAMALRVAPADGADLALRLPTLSPRPARQQRLERAFAAAYLDQDVYARNDAIVLRWPEGYDGQVELAGRLQTPDGRIFMEALPAAGPGAEHLVAKGFQALDGPHRLTLMPRAEEYYLGNIRVTRDIPLHVLRSPYSEAPYGSYAQRRQEALADAAERTNSVFCEIAKMELGRWQELRLPAIQATIDSINRRADCSDFFMVGLLGALQRYGANPAFPAELRESLEQCVLGFKYWMDEPGDDSMCYWSENHQILFHACEVLAGQLYPDRTFSNVGQSGAWHREKGGRMAISWLRKRAAGGFREWDSNCYFEEDVLALSHLADLAEDDELRELAALILDKLLFSMALNSLKGAFGSTHGRTYAPMIKGARLEGTAGMSRLLWGMGVFNDRVLGTVSLACASGYELPPLIATIAADQQDEIWSRERHAGQLEEWCDCASGPWEVNKATYKTPDYMLASAQDYHPGEPGYQQHIWQATFGPDAVVFVSHPPCLSEEGSHRPNFWHGNVVLPRVAQWKDVLIAAHNLPADDWLGFTHAYFPLAAFDEHAVRDGWAFARKGEGYVALTAARGIELITSGDSAYRELRSHGLQNVWLCHMGRAAQDGSFADFQAAILALDVQFDELAVRCATLRGQELAFGWAGPLLLDGAEEPITGFKHYDSPYSIVELGAPQMEIGLGHEGMRLNF